MSTPLEERKALLTLLMQHAYPKPSKPISVHIDTSGVTLHGGPTYVTLHTGCPQVACDIAERHLRWLIGESWDLRPHRPETSDEIIWFDFDFAAVGYHYPSSTRLNIWGSGKSFEADLNGHAVMMRQDKRRRRYWLSLEGAKAGLKTLFRETLPEQSDASTVQR